LRRMLQCGMPRRSVDWIDNQGHGEPPRSSTEPALFVYGGQPIYMHASGAVLAHEGHAVVRQTSSRDELGRPDTYLRLGRSHLRSQRGSREDLGTHLLVVRELTRRMRHSEENGTQKARVVPPVTRSFPAHVV
jgi:hypothetical protein